MKEYIVKNKYLFSLALLNFLLIYLSSFNKAYGYFIDEFYYIACAKRLAWGYVDHPPLAPFILAVFSWLFGFSLYAIRFLPALASSVIVFLTGKLAGELGGGIRAQIFSALTLICVPMAAAFASFYSMNIFEPLIALAMFQLTLSMIKNGNPKAWIWLGVLGGLGMMNKHTFALTIFVLVISLLLSEHRKYILNRWFVIGCGIILAIFLPNIFWQIANGYPTLEFYQNITVRKNVYTPPVQFMLGQLMFMSPFTAPVWIAGAIYLLASKKMKQYRFLSVVFILTVGLMCLTGTSRSDRTMFAYPVVIAGGAVFYESISKKHKRAWLMAGIAAIMLAGFVFILPLVLPYFSYEQTASMVKTLHFNTELERGKKPPLPQILADRIGWEEKSAMLFSVYNSLPDSVKKQTIIFTDNYGKAGALELFGEKYGIKQVFCQHNNYYLWGIGKLHNENVLVLDDKESARDYRGGFESVEIFPVEFSDPYVSSHENSLSAFLCKRPKAPLNEMFDRGKVYN